MKKLTVAVLALSLAACGGPKGPRAFTYATSGELTTLDPCVAYDADTQGLLFNVYETLVAFDGESNERIVGRLAAEVPSRENGLVSKDGRTYRFPVRAGVKFHDGRALTAEDARYSLLRFMLIDRDGGPSSLLLEPILGVTATRGKDGKLQVTYAQAAKAVRVDGDAVVVTLKEPFGPFLPIMARWSYVMSRSWAKEKGDWDGEEAGWERFNNPKPEDTKFYAEANGTGPYKVERWDRTGRRVILGRHEGYHRGLAPLARVVQTAVPEFATRKLLLQGGDADIIATPRPRLAQLEHGRRRHPRRPAAPVDRPSLFFTFKITKDANRHRLRQARRAGIPPDFFTDKDVRRGFAYALDYDALLKQTFKGKAARATSSIPPGLAFRDAAAPHYEFDLKQAEAHLRKAWGGRVWEKGFRFTMTYNTGGDTREAACQILKKGVESLNPKFRVDIRGVEWAAFLDKAQRKQMRSSHNGPGITTRIRFPFYHRAGVIRRALAPSWTAWSKAVREAAGQAQRSGGYHRALRHPASSPPSGGVSRRSDVSRPVNAVLMAYFRRR